MSTANESDGTPLPGGLVVSRAGGFRVAVYRCRCGREQTAACKGFPGGLLPFTAERIGWRKIGGEWHCSFCTGNTACLFGVFDGDDEKERL